MGVWDWLFGTSRKDKARAAEAARRARDTLARGDASGAFVIASTALAGNGSNSELLTISSEAMVLSGEAEMGELFLRAADAPHDASRLLELGSNLLSNEQADVASSVLSEALLLAPFDAVVRSELSLAHAYAGEPAKAVEVLAMHPCLGDDPGALFAFAWASLLAGDTGAARASVEPLAVHRSAKALVTKLEGALRRRELFVESQPRDARDFYFLEYGGVLLAPAPDHEGRFGPLDVDATVLSSILGRAAFALDALHVSDRPVVPVNDRAKPVAERLAKAINGFTGTMPAHGRLPKMILVALEASEFEPIVPRLGDPSEVITFAITVPWARGISLAPDLVGALARRVRFSCTDAEPTDLLDPALSLCLKAWGDELPACDHDTHSAYAPDAPLPHPPAEVQKK